MREAGLMRDKVRNTSQTAPARHRPLSTLVALLVALLVSSCTPLGAFNTVAGRDAGVEAVGSGIAFGAHPRSRLDIYAPRDRTAATPVVVFFYGGSWNSGSRQDYAFVGRALASLGYVTVIPDYRLVPEVVFPTFLDDGAQAVRWVSDNIRGYGGDPRRIALAGHSAGAYNAAMLALDTSYLRKAGVDTRSIRALVALSGPFDFLPLNTAEAIAALGNWPKPAQTQPITFARSGAPAAFLATGGQDTVVKPRNTEALAARLRALGSSATVRVYPELDHVGPLLSLSRLLRERAPVLEDIGRFLRQAMPLRQA